MKVRVARRYKAGQSIAVNCDVCGKNIFIYPSRLNQAKHFCSSACVGLSQRGDNPFIPTEPQRKVHRAFAWSINKRIEREQLIKAEKLKAAKARAEQLRAQYK